MAAVYVNMIPETIRRPVCDMLRSIEPVKSGTAAYF